MKRFTFLVLVSIMVALTITYVTGQSGRMFQVYDSSVLPSTITTLTGKVDTIHATTGGYTRGIVLSLSLVGGDSLYFFTLMDSIASCNGSTPRTILEVRAALDSLSEGSGNRYGYYDRIDSRPWYADTVGNRASISTQDTVWLSTFALKDINKTGQIEYRYRIPSAQPDTGTSTSRTVRMRWKIFGARPW